MKSIIFLAPPAAGKGTLSEYLVKKFGYVHISTGEILRDYAEEKESLAHQLEKGEYIEDDIIIKLVTQKIASLPKNALFILDGVPRTLKQAQMLDPYLPSNVIPINIEVDPSILLKRVLGRVVCPQCDRNYNVYFKEFKPLVDNLCDDCKVSLEKRSDDTEGSFLKRYQKYQESVLPIIKFYQEKGTLIRLENKDEDQNELIKKLVEVIDDN